MRMILTIHLILLITSLFILILSVEKNSQAINELNSDQKNPYELSWPGILPDNKFYKLKVLRNKVIGKMIINPAKKVEFDLLMADKTIYASDLLNEKGEIAFAKDAALKGEDYYSNLVQYYNQALLQHKKIPAVLDKKITKASKKHQEIFKKLEGNVNSNDKKTFQIVTNFSKINYAFIVGLRSPKK